MTKPTIIGALFLLVVSTAASAECSPQTLQGQYIFSARGFIEPLAPNVQRVHSGLLVFDGVAKLSGAETSSRGGKIAREQRLKGTYTLNGDCAGRITIDSLALPNLQTHWDVFVTADGKKASMIRTDPGSMSVRSLER
ncbi:hypothetical protein [Bradyrhizobium sp. UFLA05-112]